MKGRTLSLFGCVCGVLLLTACAKQKNPTDTELQTQSFEAWMNLYAPQAEKQESGIYTEVLTASTQTGAKTPVYDPEETINWVKINYTGRTIKGDVYTTRDSVIAKWENTFAYYNNYAPAYVRYFLMNSNTASDKNPIDGVYYALGMMKEGDVWRVYVPPALAYADVGYSISGNFDGAAAVGENQPVIIDLELVKVVRDPSEYELTMVKEYVVKELNMSTGDSIAEGLYFKSLGFLPNSDAEPDSIPTNVAFNCRYVGRLIKEDFEKIPYVAVDRAPFVFDTNIKDTADLYKLSQYQPKNHYEAPMSMTLGAEDASNILAWDSVVLGHMHYGEYGRLITTSTFGYTSDGQFAPGATYIPPYTPLVFDIWIGSKNGNGIYEFPYLIQKVLDDKEDIDDVWFYCGIYGVVTGDDITESELGLSPITDVRTNVLIGDAYWTSDPTKYIPLELPEGSELRDSLNFPDNFNKLLTAKVKLRGDIRDYFGVKGLRNVTEFKIIY